MTNITASVTKEFTFDAAHHLTKYYGKCEKPHGHTYRLLVTISGPIGQNGLLIDFVILKRIVTKHILDHLDHNDLNTILENPTAENIALWIWNKLSPLNQLLTEELEDPNLDAEIKKFLIEGAQNEAIEKSTELQKSVKIQLEQIQLYETPTSCVTLKI